MTISGFRGIIELSKANDTDAINTSAVLIRQGVVTTMPTTANSIPVRQCPQCGICKPATHEHFPVLRNGLLRPGKPCRDCILEKERAYNRAYSHKHAKSRAKRSRAWMKGNSHINIVRNANRRTMAIRLPGELTPEEWLHCREYFGQACAICGRSADKRLSIALDHWIPVASPVCPGTMINNVLPLCHSRGHKSQFGCNNSKARRDPTEWLLDVFGREEAQEILTRVNGYFESVKGGVVYKLPELPPEYIPYSVQLNLL